MVEDACTVHDAGLGFAVLVAFHPALFLGLVFVLPLTTLESLDIFCDALQVGFVEEMSTERTAPLHQLRRWVIVDALAALAINALVAGAQESRIEHPCS
ncbi:MAG: hypothetical protein RJA15_972 [Actinomycetota bacterium]